MIISVMVIQCDTPRCGARLAITDTLQPLLQALDNDWIITQVKIRGEHEPRHYCPKCGPECGGPSK